MNNAASSAGLNELAAKMKAKQDEFFKEAFTHPVTREPYKMPEGLQKAARRICLAYNIRGICDPMYIANITAFELGLGDGKSQFAPGVLERIAALEKVLRALMRDVKEIEGYWTEGLDNSMRHAAEVLDLGAPEEAA